MMISSSRPRREDLRPGQVLCEFCTARCCRYFALPIETPRSFSDLEYIRWYLLHDRASVFSENGEEETWYLLVHTVCKHLRDDHRCGIYETRPEICREYTTDECEYDDEWTYDRYFETPEQIAEYSQALCAEPGDADFRSRQPSLLPVIG